MLGVQKGKRTQGMNTSDRDEKLVKKNKFFFLFL
jgi:hypothetical protein